MQNEQNRNALPTKEASTRPVWQAPQVAMMEVAQTENSANGNGSEYAVYS